MARRRPTQQPTAVIEHPNDPSIKVTVQKLTRIQHASLAPVLAKSARAIAVEDRDGHIVTDADGEPRVFVQNVLSLDFVLARIKLAIKNWEGILDDHDQPIPYSPDRIDILTENFLDAEVDEPVPVKDEQGKDVLDESGQAKTRLVHVTYAFSAYINKELNDPKTFTSDPFVNDSGKS